MNLPNKRQKEDSYDCPLSVLSKYSFLSQPHAKPPRSPDEEMTLWHGTIMGMGLLCTACPTALEALGLPTAEAI